MIFVLENCNINSFLLKPLHTIVFFALFFIEPWQVLAQKPKPVQFTVLSLNFNHGVSPDGKTNLLKLVDVIKKHSPDVVAIQDIDSGMVRSGKLNQLRVLSLLTGYEPVFGEAAKDNGGKKGLGILTKHRFEAVQVSPLPNPENTEQKILLSAVIELPNTRFLRLCNTQLDHKSALNRGIQAAILNRTLELSLYPIVLCGDFSTTTDDHTIDFLNKKWEDVGKNNDSLTHTNTQSRVDFFWILKDSNIISCSYDVLPYPTLSVHLPILATFEMR